MPKLWLSTQALRLRLELPTSFDASRTYKPIIPQGPKAEHVIAYRRAEDVLAVAPRLTHKLAGNWSATSVALPEGRWTNRLTGQTFHGGAVRVGALLENFPVALLVRDSEHTLGRDARRSQPV